MHVFMANKIKLTICTWLFSNSGILFYYQEN